ncbi:lasso peptide biosynthesis B2 protein [Sphingomonas sp. MMS24-J45]|uniref:lasso peptide biosynthesis B2 protein n=1 Tax=Sphingomonas sp. MMS24-J45 TaxID=3238806 RepID=UPI0038502456
MSARARKPWRRVRHRLARIGQTGLRDHTLLIEAAIGLAIARAAVLSVPFPRIARRLGGFMTPHVAAEKAQAALPNAEQKEIARKVGWAVTVAARNVPFKAVCLPQAMTAHQMLQKRGIFSVIHFGTAPGADLSLDAHAWLDAGEVQVTGYPVAPEFTEIACIA